MYPPNNHNLSELATYSKISSFGSKNFPCLSYPQGMASEQAQQLMNALLMPVAETRIGARSSGQSSSFDTLKKHPFFTTVNTSNGASTRASASTANEDWEAIEAGDMKSPFAKLSKNEYNAIILEGFDESLRVSFDTADDVASSDSWFQKIKAA